MNRREAAALSGAPKDATPAAFADGLRAAGLGSGVITAGSAAVTGFDADGIFSIAPPALQSMIDATGAGDALAGVTAAAMMHGKPLRAALREGIAAAVLTIAHPKAVAEISERGLAETLALVPEAQAVA
jgi:sugar/nucleoside kinase (ribokinase family)